MALGNVKAKGRMSAAQAKGKRFETHGDTGMISAAVWGQLQPLDRVAREKIARWGDTLPSLVPPELAGRFEAAYDALGAWVELGDVVKVSEVAGQLIRAWDVLEKAAMDAGHKPLAPEAWCVDVDGRIVCFALRGWAEIRKANPTWIVYAFEDAARVLLHDFSENFLNEAFSAFPNAKVTSVVRKGERVNLDLGGDDIPF